MSRMYSRKKGKSGSTRPTKTTIPSWCKHKGKEVEILISKLAREGHSSSKIGIILKDSYGIPSVKAITKRSINQIMEEKGFKQEIPEDLMSLIKKSVKLIKHRENNRQDKTALRGVQLAESKIRRLIKYYKKTGRLATEWKYDPERIKLYVG